MKTWEEVLQDREKEHSERLIKHQRTLIQLRKNGGRKTLQDAEMIAYVLRWCLNTRKSYANIR